MKTYLILFMLCFFSIIGVGQTLELERASPFTAVKWEQEQPDVKFEDDWYHFEKLEHFNKKEILDFCKKEFGDKWQKRFSEDLVEVLQGLGYQPKTRVTLKLSKDGVSKVVTGTFTFENRQKVYAYNKAQKNVVKYITVPKVIEDIKEFEKILENRSSYVQVTDYNYKNAIERLKKTVSEKRNTIAINFLTHELAKIMAEIGDRHSSVKNDGFEYGNKSTHALQLPFKIAPLHGKAVALKPQENKGEYDYLYPNFPILKSINNRPVQILMDSLAYKPKKAPKDARFVRGLLEVQNFGRLYFKNNLKLPKQVDMVFTNGKTDKTETIELQHEQFRYASKVQRIIFSKSKAIKDGNLKSISKLLKGNIGYISLPEMYSFDEIQGLEKFIDSTFDVFDKTKALIIDLRFNPGGTRDLIQKMANYIIPKSHSPWVSNVAYLRTEDKAKTHKSMSNRFLYTDDSKKFNALDRKEIAIFSEKFSIEKEFDTSKFSRPHYMVLRSGDKRYTKPVYILVNEQSFSAATVFTSAFKGLPNVNIVGVTTDGSSGNSRKFYLKNSNIRLKVSTMLSFQRNGKTLDGNGTTPDIIIPVTEKQVLKGEDGQLKQLVEMINSGK